MPKPTPEETQALLAKGDALGAKASKETGIAYTPIAQIPTIVNSSVLQGTGTPINLPKTESTPTTSGLAMTNDRMASTAKTTAPYVPPEAPQQDWLQQYLQQSSERKNQYFDDVASLQGEIANEATQAAQFAEQEQLQKKDDARRALSDQLDKMEKTHRDEIAAIKLNPEGKFGGALAADVNKANDLYQNYRANVVLEYNTTVGDYNSAAQIVNDKVQSLQNQHAQQMNAYKLTADAIWNDLTESETLIVQENQKRMAEQRQLVTDAYKATLGNASANGAPASVFAAIDEASRLPNATAADILAAAGTYGQAVETSVVEAGNRKLLINNRTGATIKDLGVADVEAGGGGGMGGSVGSGTPIIDASGNVLEFGTPEYIAARLQATAGSKTKPVASEREQLGKFANVVALTDNLMNSLNKTTNDPILGYMRSLNPYDFDARAVNAQVTALVPSVARALYGEVGVLTDTDIERYLKTLPNIRSTADQNKFIAMMTLGNARRAYEQTLLNLASSNVNVSGFVDSYKNLSGRLDKLEGELGANATGDTPAVQQGETNDIEFASASSGETRSVWNKVGSWAKWFFGF